MLQAAIDTVLYALCARERTKLFWITKAKYAISFLSQKKEPLSMARHSQVDLLVTGLLLLISVVLFHFFFNQHKSTLQLSQGPTHRLIWFNPHFKCLPHLKVCLLLRRGSSG